MRRLPWIIFCSFLITFGGAFVLLGVASVVTRPAGVSAGEAIAKVLFDEPCVLVLLVGSGAILALVLFARALARGPGLHACNECGYDLRGSAPDRCPECGARRARVDPP